MPAVRAEVTVQRDLAELAPTVADFYTVHTWLTSATDTVRDESRPDTRIVTLASGSRVVEELIASGPTFVHYRMIDDDPASPISDYESELRIESKETGGVLLSWAARFTCDPSLEAVISESVRTTCEQGLVDLSKA